MSVSIAGLGWVTPLGAGIDQVWERLLAGTRPETEEVQDPVGSQTYPVYRVPSDTLKNLPPNPRLRRASAISRFSAAAGLEALRDAQLVGDALDSGRLALIFGVANGGVIYTKRFYSDIVNTGAEAASPLLFPETVFNAAASHLAAIIGLTGATYTVVGDGTVGLSAIEMGRDLIEHGEADHCLIVAAEEADWLLCDAYRKWRLLRKTSPIAVFRPSPNGTILSEGAGAVVLSRTGPIEISGITSGNHFSSRRSAPAALSAALKRVNAASDIVISSANGTFVDACEAAAVADVSTRARLYAPKLGLGEGVAAGGLWQMIVAVQALRKQELPWLFTPASGALATQPVRLSDTREIDVLSCGLNQQVGAARLTLAA